MAANTVAIITSKGEFIILQEEGFYAPSEEGETVIIRTGNQLSAYQWVKDIGLYKVEMDEETLLKLALLEL